MLWLSRVILSARMDIRVKSLIIREFEERDLRAFAHYRSDPSIAQYQSWSSYTYQDAVKLHGQMKSVPFGTVGYWFQLAIEDSAQSELIGDLAVHFVDDQQIEIGFTVSPNHQRRGVAFTAVTALLTYLFKELGKHRVYAVTDAENSASCLLLEKVGFRKEAHFIDNIYFKGAWGSECIYAILNREWRKDHC